MSMDNTMKMIAAIAPSTRTYFEASQPMNANAAVMPLQTHWDSRQLADAVPLRLSQMLDFSAKTLATCERASANAAALHGTRRSPSFLPMASMTLFRTR